MPGYSHELLKLVNTPTSIIYLSEMDTCITLDKIWNDEYVYTEDGRVMRPPAACRPEYIAHSVILESYLQFFPENEMPNSWNAVFVKRQIN